MKKKDESKAKGGKARAAALPPEARSKQAKNAALARWAIPQAEYTGELKIGDMQFPCSVLSDGTRILTQSDFMTGMGMYYSGWVAKNQPKDSSSAELPHFLAFKSLKPYINKNLGDLQSISLRYRTAGGKIAHGIKAEIIPNICGVWLDANENTKLGSRQKKIALSAKILMRSLAHVGIVALVDEATGYQDVRSRNALAKILEAFIDKELQPWTKTFPESFYQEIFRLRGWSYKALAGGQKPKRPGVLGKYTIDLVYERLAPGIYEELQNKNPKSIKGRRKTHHHRWFTSDLGHPKLSAHIEAITAIAKISPTWDTFLLNVNKVYPKPGTTIPLNI